MPRSTCYASNNASIPRNSDETCLGILPSEACLMFQIHPIVALALSALCCPLGSLSAQASAKPPVAVDAQDAKRPGSPAANRLLVEFRTDKNPADLGIGSASFAARLAEDVRALGGHVTRSWGIVPAALVEIEEEHRARIEALPYVQAVDSDRWHAPRIRTATDNAHHAADALQARGIRGSGSTLACVDTGFDIRYPGSPASANPFPGLPSEKRLPPNTNIAFRVTTSGGRIDGISLWCASGARSASNLALVISPDVNGRPGPRPIANASLVCPARPTFSTARFQASLQLPRGTNLWVQFRTPADTSQFFVLADSGEDTPAYTGSALGALPLAWKLIENGRTTRPHRSLTASTSVLRDRIRVHRQIGGVDTVETHGTMLAAIAAGTRWASNAADEGHAPDANLALYACADDATGNARTSTLLTALEKLFCDVPPIGVDVVLFGYSGGVDPRSLLQRALDSIARNGDVLVVLPAGNSGSSLATSHIGLNAITVGAVDGSKLVAGFSSRGSIAGLAYPDMVAHGVRVVGPQANAEARDFGASGTSLAAAQIAGAAVQLRGAFPQIRALEMRAILLAGSEASPGTSSSQSATGPGVGYLRNDQSYAIASTGRLKNPRFGTDRMTTTRNTWRRSIPVRSGQQLQFAICWERIDSRSTLTNLDVVLRNGSGRIIARSQQTRSTQEFVRLRAAQDDLWSIEVVSTRLDARRIEFSYASNLNTDGGNQSARYSENGTGCKGGGTGGGCPAMKQDPKDLSFMPALPPKTAHAILVQCPCPVTMRGFSLYSRASLPNTPMECYLWKSTVSNEPQLVAAGSGIMTLQTTPGYYSVTFTSPVSLTVDEASNFFIGFRTPGSSLIWADNGTGYMGHHFEMPDWWGAWIGGGGFGGAITMYSWDWRTDCIPDASCPGGAVPILFGVGLPILGSRSFGVGLEQGLPNSVAILLTGIETRCIGLKAIGAQACGLCCNTVFNVGQAIDRQGGAQVTLGVPQDRNLIGAAFANQWLILDQKANRLGLTLSGHGQGLIGTR